MKQSDVMSPFVFILALKWDRSGDGVSPCVSSQQEQRRLLSIWAKREETKEVLKTGGSAEDLLTSEGLRTIHLLFPHNRDVCQEEVSVQAAWLPAKLSPRFVLSNSPVET